MAIETHTARDLGLKGYKAWRTSLKPYPEGTVFKILEPYVGVTASTSIAVGQELKIVGIGPGINRDPVYKMVVHRNGKTFRKTLFFSIEIIARWVIDGRCKIISNENE